MCFNHLWGIEFYVSPVLEDKGKIEFKVFTELLAVKEFNRWLRDRFGIRPTYLLSGRKAFCTQTSYDVLKEQMKEGK